MEIEKVFNDLALNSSCQQQHEDVLAKGFDNFHVPTLLMLIVSELSEALEADRKNRHANISAMQTALSEIDDKIGDITLPPVEENEKFKAVFEVHVKDTFEDEIADAFLRLMDLCGAYGIDIERHIQMKAYYNKLRPQKHGKEY